MLKWQTLNSYNVFVIIDILSQTMTINNTKKAAGAQMEELAVS